MSRADAPVSGTLTHDALFYHDDAGFVGALVPFVRQGQADGHAVVAAVTRPNIDLLRDALGTDARGVVFIDRDTWYRRPGSTVAGWRRQLAEATDRGHTFLRVIGEVGFGAAERHPSWTRYESALNLLFAGSPTWIVCPYDTRALPAAVVADARRTHPTVLDPVRRDSGDYVAAEDFLLSRPEPMPPPAGPPVVEVPLDDEVAAARRAVRRVATAAGWPASDRLDDLLLATSEVVGNSVRHGYGRRTLRVWIAGDSVVCEVSDEGPGPVDPLIGYRPPADSLLGGRGLWITQQVCDAVVIRRRDGGNSVWYSVSADPPAANATATAAPPHPDPAAVAGGSTPAYSG